MNLIKFCDKTSTVEIFSSSYAASIAKNNGPKFSLKFYRSRNSGRDVTAADPQEAVEADGHPVGQQLLHSGLGASQQQFGLRVAVLLHQSPQQRLHHLRQV